METLDLEEGHTETLIDRAATALGIGVPEDEVRASLLNSGEKRDDVELAIVAAKILNKSNNTGVK
jgi:hypothetical protein